MKKILLLFAIVAIQYTASAQKNFLDEPYIEINAKADSLVVPDRIFMSINLNEADSKNKKSVEDQEKILESTLKNLNIDTEKDLSLLDFTSSFKNYFLKGQNVVKAKSYSLLVHDAVTAGKVLAELESLGISNVNIERTEYSKAEELILELKTIAMKKSKETAEKLARAIGQKAGRAVYISDLNTISNGAPGQTSRITIRGLGKLYGNKAPDPIYTEFEKLKFAVQISVKYWLN